MPGDARRADSAARGLLSGSDTTLRTGDDSNEMPVTTGPAEASPGPRKDGGCRPAEARLAHEVVVARAPVFPGQRRLVMTNWARRLRLQQGSACSVQTGASSP